MGKFPGENLYGRRVNLMENWEVEIELVFIFFGPTDDPSYHHRDDEDGDSEQKRLRSCTILMRVLGWMKAGGASGTKRERLTIAANGIGGGGGS
jgi:hypothetical protein